MGRALFTVGHSTRSLDGFLALLRAHGVERVADVRRFPGSRRNPHFGLEPLRDQLRAAGLGYGWYPQLGGRRTRIAGAPPSPWRVAAFAAYADHMNSAEFRVTMRRLLDEAADASTAVMCAEAFPYQCHRRLISDWAELHGISVEHILDDERRERHRLTPFARFARGQVTYADEAEQVPLGLEPRV